MIDLTNPEEVKKLDPKDVYGSTEMFPAQCEQIWQEGILAISEDYRDITNIIVCGMGGSAYGGYVVSALFKEELTVPLYSNNDYHLPGFADESSLVILSSYSGSTEEVLSCAEEAYKKNCKVVGLTGGGKLSELLKSHNSPVLIFDPKNNPSGQPRLGTGYMVLGFIKLLTNLKLLQVSDEEVQSAISELKNATQDTKSQAMTISKKLVGFIPVILCSEFLNGNAHIMRNQINETAKSFSAFEDIPELNHHLMEGLKNPTDKKLAGLFLQSNLYSPVHQKRNELTKDVVSQNGVSHTEYNPKGSTKLSQMLSALSFGGYLSLFLALRYGQDPSVIPWVDYFKEQLAKT